MRTCKDCGETKELEEFPKTHNGYYYRRCIPCSKKHRSEQNLRLNYGITKEDYDVMFAEQNGQCAICGIDEPKGRYQTFNVDHCHDTGKVRGLLCRKCNMALGAFGDNISTLTNAINYLNGPLNS